MRTDDVLMKMNIYEKADGTRFCEMDGVFTDLYGEGEEILSRQRLRYTRALRAFFRAFPKHGNDAEISVFSAPGRTEIGGNHTDHQHGSVLAAAIDLDAIAVVSENGENVIRLLSEGYPLSLVDLSDFSPREEEKGTSSSLIRGVAAQFAERSVPLRGLDIYMTSDVLSGSGLSSSAAFEVLMGTILDTLFNDGKAGAVEIAKFGQKAENVYFGKACGLMDQMVSSVGGFVKIDFSDTEDPKIRKYECDLEKAGLVLIVTDTGGSHADLSGEYSAIPQEMKKVAAFFGKEYLREVDEEDFYRSLPELVKVPDISDRAILRSVHFFSDDKRVEEEAEALEEGDIARFLKFVNASGRSSETLLQNLYCNAAPEEQKIPLALMLSRRVLGKEGACRVHGGGFAGTIQAFVPKSKVAEYKETLEAVFGEEACHILRIRQAGGIRIF